MTNCPCDQRIFPPPLVIPAGLTTLPRQIATFPEFRAAMLAAIGAYPPLAEWRARAGDDFGVMLLEMWAYVCDAVSFYDEVIAHEVYLRTSRLRPSLRKLVGLLGYIPRPAIAATVTLAALADGRKPVTLPPGTAFRSGAFDGNPPQVFELDAQTPIHPFFNQWPLAPVRPSTIGGALYVESFLLLQPDSVSLKKDDVVLLQRPAGSRILSVNSVASHAGKDGESYTKAEFDRSVNLAANTPVSQVKLLKPSSTATLWKLGGTVIFDAWFEPGTWLLLDGVQRQIRPGNYILLSKESEYRWFRVTKVSESLQAIGSSTTSTLKDANGNVTGSITSPAPTAPATWILLDDELNTAGRSSISSPANWSYSEPEAITVHFGLTRGGTVTVEARTTLAGADPLIAAGALELPSTPSAPGSFLVEDANGQGAAIAATLNFTTGSLALGQGEGWDDPLAVPVRLYGNLLAASRGETVNGEILGSGDGSASNQSFTLKKSPLTYLPSPTAGNPSGAASTLKIYVNGVQWTEAPTFFGVASDAQVYIVRQNDSGESVVTFGDGLRGSRLPSGTNNVLAYYRFGAGLASPPAGSINQLAKPFTGLKSVKNPVAAAGGADAEDSANLQTYAPRSALLLGRAVSIPDFEAAAAGQGGVRAVSAEWRWNQARQRPLVQICYIGEAGIESAISQALRGIADPNTPIQVEPAEAVARQLSIDIEIDERYLEDDVLAAVRDALTNTTTGLLAPERVGIGKPLYRSRIFEAVLGVPGAAGVRSLLLDGAAFPDYAVTPGAGHYFDFETGGVLLNGKAGSHG